MSAIFLGVLTVILVVFFASGKKKEQTGKITASGNFTVAFDRTDYSDLEKPVPRQERHYGRSAHHCNDDNQRADHCCL